MTAIKHWAWLVVNAGHLESLMDLLAQVIISQVLRPIITHLNCLVRAGVRHFEEAFLYIGFT